MKKSLIALTVVAAAAGMLYAGAPKDPVLLTVADKPVTLSEFEYLYHKNNSQQLAPQTIDEYLQMFITYKQKVAAAEEAGIDKSQAFQREFDGYRRDLAAPYLSVQEVEDSIIKAEYARMGTEVDVSHIMVAHNAPDTKADQRELLNSIRDSILAGSDFEAMARKYSIDRAVVRNGGHMGYITACRLPYTFEDAAYTTAPGNISPVISTPVGYHIVKVHATRPAQGMVLVDHILKLTQGLSAEEAAKKKEQIDSIYNLVKNGGADFSQVAMAESEDPGSAKMGGRLRWFGTGQMVPEFEKVAFSLSDGEISEPFPTTYGYHIIRRLEHKGIDSLDAVRQQIKMVISRDERGTMAHDRKVAQLRKKFKVQAVDKNMAQIRERIMANGSVDSTLRAEFLTSDLVLARAGKKDIVLLSEVASDIMPNPQGNAEAAVADFDRLVNRNIDNAVTDLEREDLAVNNADYRNLLNEYRDGMLLFEISDQNVWSRAKNDKEGLEKFFNDNRAKYTWESPRFKSYVVFATSDSIMNLAQNYLNENNIGADNLVSSLRKEFGKDVKVEKVIAAEGENPITDYLGFNGPKPEPKGKWAFYFPYLNKIIDAPEEAADERGIVTTDYQNLLEEEWKAELARKYPAKVNEKVLKKAR